MQLLTILQSSSSAIISLFCLSGYDCNNTLHRHCDTKRSSKKGSMGVEADRTHSLAALGNPCRRFSKTPQTSTVQLLL